MREKEYMFLYVEPRKGDEIEFVGSLLLIHNHRIDLQWIIDTQEKDAIPRLYMSTEPPTDEGFMVRNLEADLIDEKERWEEFKNEEGMREFLLGREFDIANGEADLGSLRNLFRTIFKREPRDAYRCFKCSTALFDVHYAVEDRYPFEGWRGWCAFCKITRDVEDPE